MKCALAVLMSLAVFAVCCESAHQDDANPDKRNAVQIPRRQGATSIVENYNEMFRLCKSSAYTADKCTEIMDEIFNVQLHQLGNGGQDVFVGIDHITNWNEFYRLCQKSIYTGDKCTEIIDELFNQQLKQDYIKTDAEQDETQCGLTFVENWNGFYNLCTKSKYSEDECTRIMDELFNQQLNEEYGWKGIAGTYYKWFDGGYTFNEAKDKCAKENGRLPVVKNENVNDFINKLKDPKTYPNGALEYIWLSAKKDEVGWSWVNNGSSKAPFGWTNWSETHFTNEPGEDCVIMMMKHGGKWNDHYCFMKYGLICERNDKEEDGCTKKIKGGLTSVDNFNEFYKMCKLTKYTADECTVIMDTIFNQQLKENLSKTKTAHYRSNLLDHATEKDTLKLDHKREISSLRLEMTEKINKLKQCVSPNVQFMAYFNPTTAKTYQWGDVMIFDNVTTDTVITFDVSNGVFKCPMTGLYQLSLSINTVSNLALFVLEVNGKQINTALADDRWGKGNWNTGSFSVPVLLHKNDQVVVKAGDDNVFIRQDSHMPRINYFSGHLIRSQDCDRLTNTLN